MGKAISYNGYLVAQVSFRRPIACVDFITGLLPPIGNWGAIGIQIISTHCLYNADHIALTEITHRLTFLLDRAASQLSNSVMYNVSG